MDDNSTRVLQRPGSAADNSTRVFKAPPPAPPPPVKRSVPWPLRLVWGSIRFGVVCISLLVIAQALSELVGNPWLSWTLALVGGLLAPVGGLLWVRKTLKARNPNARVRISLFNWEFGWNLLLLLVLFFTLPGILTEAVAVQGSAFSQTLARATAPDHIVPRATHWLTGAASSGSELLETAAFGESRVAPRVAVARRAVDAELTGLPAVDAIAVPVPGAEGSSPQGASGGGAAAPGSIGAGAPGVPVIGAGGDAGVPVAGAGGVSAVPVGAAGVPVGAAGDGAGAPVQGGTGTAAAPDGTSLAGGEVGGGLVSGGSHQTSTTGAPLSVSGADRAGGAGGVPKQLPSSSSARTSAATSLVEIPLRREGSTVVLDVVIDRRFPARLLLDTGASYTTLSATALQRFGLTPSPTAPIITTETARGPRQDTLTVADTVAIGGLELSGVAILRCDACATAEHDGLLGMNVLNNFSVNIDQEHGVVRLEDKRARGDQRMDIAPFVGIEAVPEASSLPLQPFVVTATNRAMRAIPTLSAQLTLLNEKQEVVATHVVKLPPLPAGQRVSIRTDVPREPPYVYYQIELADAHW